MIPTAVALALALASPGIAAPDRVPVAAQTQVAPPRHTSTEGYVNSVAVGDMFIVQASQVALKRLKNGAIRDFAQSLAADHRQATQALKQALAKSNTRINVPGMLGEQHRDELERLGHATDAQFPGTYLAMALRAERQIVQAHYNYAKAGDVPALNAYAHRMEEITERDLLRLRMLAGKTGRQRIPNKF